MSKKDILMKIALSPDFLFNAAKKSLSKGKNFMEESKSKKGLGDIFISKYKGKLKYDQSKRFFDEAVKRGLK